MAADKKYLRICLASFVISCALLATDLPMKDVSATGNVATAFFLVLNPPFVAVLLAAPHDEHEMEQSAWPQWQYPSAVLVSLIWWFGVFRTLRFLSSRRRSQLR